jgi:hypothetical protein
VAGADGATVGNGRGGASFRILGRLLGAVGCDVAGGFLVDDDPGCSLLVSLSFLLFFGLTLAPAPLCSLTLFPSVVGGPVGLRFPAVTVLLMM